MSHSRLCHSILTGFKFGFLRMDFAIQRWTCWCVWDHCPAAGPEWPSGELGELAVGRSGPFINWAGRLACFFFFLHTHNNVYVFKLPCD